MGSFAHTGCSGEGKVAITGSGGPFADLLADITTAGSLVYESTAKPRRVFKAGWAGFGYDDGTGHPLVMAWSYLDFEYGMIQLLKDNPYGDHLFWKLQTGVIATLTIEW
jgi:hypothetical protein